MLIEGVFAAVTTPFYPDERVYFRKIEANIARYSRSLLAGMVVLGSTGEAAALSDAEIARCAANGCGSGVAGEGVDCRRGTREREGHARTG